MRTNFFELRRCEVRRIRLPGRSVNKGKKGWDAPNKPPHIYRLGLAAKAYVWASNSSHSCRHSPSNSCIRGISRHASCASWFSHAPKERNLLWRAPIPPDHCRSQLLPELDVELHPDQGGEIEEKAHQGVQTGVLSAGRNRSQTPRPDLPGAQSGRECAEDLAPEERHRVYKLLRLSVRFRPDWPPEVSGVFAEFLEEAANDVSHCKISPLSV